MIYPQWVANGGFYCLSGSFYSNTSTPSLESQKILSRFTNYNNLKNGPGSYTAFKDAYLSMPPSVRLGCFPFCMFLQTRFSLRVKRDYLLSHRVILSVYKHQTGKKSEYSSDIHVAMVVWMFLQQGFSVWGNKNACSLTE